MLVGDNEVHVTTKTKCITLPLPNSCEIPELKCIQDEADTRLLFHAQHASCHYDEAIIYTPDTDVFVIALSRMGLMPIYILKLELKVRRGFISLNSIDDYIGNNICKAECNPRDVNVM